MNQRNFGKYHSKPVLQDTPQFMAFSLFKIFCHFQMFLNFDQFLMSLAFVVQLSTFTRSIIFFRPFLLFIIFYASIYVQNKKRPQEDNLCPLEAVTVQYLWFYKICQVFYKIIYYFYKTLLAITGFINCSHAQLQQKNVIR